MKLVKALFSVALLVSVVSSGAFLVFEAIHLLGIYDAHITVGSALMLGSGLVFIGLAVYVVAAAIAQVSKDDE